MTAKAKEFRLKGWHVLACLIAFFGVIFAVNGVMIYLAVGSFTGEDVGDAYARGLRYNEAIERKEAAAALGWVMEVELDEAAQRLRVTLTDEDKRPVSGLDLQGMLRRPVQARLDRPLMFRSLAEGRYEAEVDDLAEGQWDLDVSARAADGTLFEARRRL